MNKNDILARLQAGESIDAIGQELADMMNAANAEYEASKKESEKDARRRELTEELVGLIQEWAELEGMNADDYAVTEDEIDMLMKTMMQTFSLAADLKKAIGSSVKEEKKRSDDEILRDFVNKWF